MRVVDDVVDDSVDLRVVREVCNASFVAAAQLDQTIGVRGVHPAFNDVS